MRLYTLFIAMALAMQFLPTNSHADEVGQVIAKKSWKVSKVHRDFKTGLKLHEDWRKRVTFHDPLALNPKVTFPQSIDLRKKAPHGFPPIKDQGQCGDCYIFGAVAALEGTIALEQGKVVSLSEEQVLSCNGQYDCGGGYFDILNYLVNPGLISTSVMPYEGNPTTCPSPLGSILGKARQWLFVGGSDQQVPSNDQLRQVLQFKPTTVTVCADDQFMQYQGGIYDAPNNQCGTNHMVALVGYGVDPVKGLYYILRNSWGTSFGEAGYMRITPRSNNLAEAASFVRL